MHDACHAFVARAVHQWALNNPRHIVVEIGSLDVNGSVRGLFYDVMGYVGVDRVAGPGVDVVCDGAEYVPAFPVDVVVTTEALEHCAHWREVLLNAHRMLVPGGVLVVTAAGPERAPHSCDGGSLKAGEYYGNIRPGALLDALAPFAHRQVDADTRAGDVYAVAVKGRP